MQLNRNGEYEGLIDAYFSFRLNGYVDNFNLKSGCLDCTSLNIEIWPESFQVDGHYYFKSKLYQDVGSVFYAISSVFGVRGILHCYCDYSVEILSEEMKSKLKLAELCR